MRFISQIKNKKRSAGFTLIEVLIIAPIVILAVGGFVAVMVTMVGDVLVTRDQSSLSYETQSALDRIEQDAKLSTQFLVTSGTQVSPQGSDSNFTGTAAFTNTTNTLIFSTLATTKNPSDTERGLVYYANQPNACGADQRYNRPMLTKTMYFIKSGSLWRRTVVPDWNTNATVDNNTVCNDVWQRNSCSPGYPGSNRCQTNDEKVMDNVSSMTTKYYTSPESTTDVGASAALTASTIDVTVNSSKTTAGNPITDTGTVRVTKLNDIDTTQLPPDVPVVAHSLASPNSVEFTWSPVSGATVYQTGYRINGGTWITQTLGPATTNYNVTANRNDVIDFRIASFNAAGSSAYATDSQTLPAWGAFKLKANWVDYDANTYQAHGFTKTSAGVVMLKGLIKDGSTATDTTIGTLPEGYRPASRLVFVASTYTAGGGGYSAGPGRIAIFPDGSIVASEMNASYLSLDGISFLAEGSGATWTSPAFSNQWSNYGAATWQPFRYTMDTIGRVHTQGTIKKGNPITDTTTIAVVPANHRPENYNIFSAKIDLASGSYGSFGAHPTSSIVARNVDSVYLNTTIMYYPTGSTWTTPADTALGGSWVRFGTGYNAFGYKKGADGIVSLRGLIKSGDTASTVKLFTLPTGFRPAKSTVLVANRARSYGRVDVLANGDVMLRYSSATWTSLDGINFLAEP
jgi:Tfp pilus assembly protein PilV